MAKKTGTSARAIIRANALSSGAPVELKPMRVDMPFFEGDHTHVGRPRTTVKDLPENWREIMLAEAEKGGGVTAYMVKLKIGPTVLETLSRDSAEFQNILGYCVLLQKFWWEDQGRKMACGEANGNSAVWALNMTNRFNWRSGRNEVVGDANNPVSLEVRDKTMTKEELLAELAERGLPTRIFEE